jgi:uncharacterized membrane protein
MDPRHTLTRILRNKLVAGLLILVPIILTTKALIWLFVYLDGLAAPAAAAVFDRAVPGVGFVTTMGVVFLTGALFSRGPLKSLLEGLEGLLDAVPVVGAVYGTTKKVLSGFGGTESEAAFQRFVLARLPGRTTPGFLMGSFLLETQDGRRTRLMSVYVPTNHLYVGDIVVLPEADVLETTLSVEDGVSMILSAGAAVPAVIAERSDAEGLGGA